MARQKISQGLKDKLLVEANHACTICGHSGVQIHHIDGDRNNNLEDNLIVLCLAHHDEAEKSKAGRGLSANIGPSALRKYKRRLKAGQRPVVGQAAPANSVDADVRDVKDSTIIISTGDVVVNAPLTPLSARGEQEGQMASEQVDDEQRAGWREQLAIHRKSLSRSEIQLAKFGSLNAPLWLLSQIDDERVEIERLERLLTIK